MFMLYALPVGIVAGLALGGRMESLGDARLRYVLAFVLALALQVALFSTPLGETAWALAYGPAVYVGSLVLVLVGLLANRRGRGVHLVIAGSLCNLAVIVGNGGRMPVLREAMLAVKGQAGVQMLAEGRSLTNVALMQEGTPLWFLGDIFAMPEWLPLANVYSAGDVLAGVGVAVWLAELMRPRRIAFR